MLHAMITMVALIYIIGIYTAYIRMSSVRKGLVKVRYFKLMQGEEIPEIITKTTRQFNNMFEVPMLFFFAGVLYLVLGIESMTGVIAAWTFVGLRAIQAIIHLTYNYPLHRMLAFNTGNICIVVLWVIIAMNAS